jgi:hypothetical protein
MKRKGMRDEEEKHEQDKNKEVCEEWSQKKELTCLNACLYMMKRKKNGHRKHFLNLKKNLNLKCRMCECTIININKNVNVKND